MQEEKNLEAIVVKRKRVLLPIIDENSYCISTDWIMVRNNWIYSIFKGKGWKINTDILIQEKESNPFGYYLYGTDIPIRFFYPKEFQHVYPDISKCIGIICNDYKISKYLYQPDRKFIFKDGKNIQDYDVIEWLENSQNVETMKYLCEYVCRYDTTVQEFLQKKHYHETLQKQYEANNEARKIQEKKDMIVREKKLVSQYYQL